MRVEPQFRKRNWQYLQLKCCGVDHTYVIIFWSYSLKVFGLLLWVSGKESACSTGDTGDSGSISGSGRSSGRGNGNSTPVFLLGESDGQRGLAGYSPRGSQRVGHDLVIKQQQRSNQNSIVLAGKQILRLMGQN